MSSSSAPRPLRGHLIARTVGACLPLALLAGVAGTQTSVTADAPVTTDTVTTTAATSYRWAAHRMNPTNPLANRTWGVYKGNRQVTHPHPSFTPDEKQVLFSCDAEAEPALYLVDIA